MLHNKHIHIIVVPHICCSKNPTTCTCFFLWSAVRLDPYHHSDTVSKFTVSQWDRISFKVGYHDHVWIVSSQRDYESVNPQSEVVWQPGQQVWVAVLISQQPTQRNKKCVRMFFTRKHIILIHVKHRVSIYACLFLCTVSPTAVGNQRRGCLLKHDMSAGEDDNCCSGRLSIGNLQGFPLSLHTSCLAAAHYCTMSGDVDGLEMV